MVTLLAKPTREDALRIKWTALTRLRFSFDSGCAIARDTSAPVSLLHARNPGLFNLLADAAHEVDPRRQIDQLVAHGFSARKPVALTYPSKE